MLGDRNAEYCSSEMYTTDITLILTLSDALDRFRVAMRTIIFINEFKPMSFTNKKSNDTCFLLRLPHIDC